MLSFNFFNSCAPSSLLEYYVKNLKTGCPHYAMSISFCEEKKKGDHELGLNFKLNNLKVLIEWSWPFIVVAIS